MTWSTLLGHLSVLIDSKVTLVARFIKNRCEITLSYWSVRFSTYIDHRKTKISRWNNCQRSFEKVACLWYFFSSSFFSLLRLDLYRKIHGRRLDPWKQGFAQVQETAAVSQLWTLCRNTWYLKYDPELAWKVAPIASFLIYPTVMSGKNISNSIKIDKHINREELSWF